jgi:hypothetical protein
MTRTTTPHPALRRALAGAVALQWASTATAAPLGFCTPSNDSKVSRAHGNGVGWAGIGGRLCHVVNERQMAA